MKVAIFVDPLSPRSRRIADAMAAGVRRHGDLVETWNWADVPPSGFGFGDVAIGYGWAHPELLRKYPRFVHIDLGWWKRKPEGRPLEGFHKVSVNARDPSAYFRRGMSADRLHRTKEHELQPWRAPSTGPILIAGMSAKSAGTYRLLPEQWESNVVSRLQRITGRSLQYRPKPSWLGSKPITGTQYVDGSDIAAILKNHGVHAVVTHHSNVAVDAIFAGIPFHVEENTVAHGLSTEIDLIDHPNSVSIEERVRLLSDLAWQQWSPGEMAAGECWAHLKENTPLCT